VRSQIICLLKLGFIATKPSPTIIFIRPSVFLYSELNGSDSTFIRWSGLLWEWCFSSVLFSLHNLCVHLILPLILLLMQGFCCINKAFLTLYLRIRSIALSIISLKSGRSKSSAYSSTFILLLYNCVSIRQISRSQKHGPYQGPLASCERELASLSLSLSRCMYVWYVCMCICVCVEVSSRIGLLAFLIQIKAK